jgi:hypothetical protein
VLLPPENDDASYLVLPGRADEAEVLNLTKATSYVPCNGFLPPLSHLKDKMSVEG